MVRHRLSIRLSTPKVFKFYDACLCWRDPLAMHAPAHEHELASLETLKSALIFLYLFHHIYSHNYFLHCYSPDQPQSCYNAFFSTRGTAISPPFLSFCSSGGFFGRSRTGMWAAGERFFGFCSSNPLALCWLLLCSVRLPFFYFLNMLLFVFVLPFFSFVHTLYFAAECSNTI